MAILRQNLRPGLLILLICLFNLTTYASMKMGNTSTRNADYPEKTSDPVKPDTKAVGLQQNRQFSALGPASVFNEISDNDPILIDNQSTDPRVERAHQLYEFVVDNNRFTNFLDTQTLLELPVGINKNIGGKDYVIIIESMTLKPTGTYLTAYMSFGIPGSDEKLAFMAEDIGFTQAGGLTGDAKLVLLEDVTLPFSQEKLALTMKGGDGKTYVEWDCYGFKSMGIGMDISFSRDWLIPENPDGSKGNGRVTTSFETEIFEWGDLTMAVSLPPFQMKGLDGVGFHVDNAIFDFSELKNPDGITFPESYSSTHLDPGAPELWEGFYMERLTVKVPPQFERKDGQRTEFQARNLLIDKHGLSGLLSGKNLISKEQGKMGNWAFSLDSLGVAIETNQLIEAGFKGIMNVPTFKDKDLLYSAVINPGNDYLFLVETGDKLNMNAWRADLELYESSYIEVSLTGGKFVPKAYFNGNLSIKSNISKTGGTQNNAAGKKDASLGGIAFEGLEITTEKPYMKVAHFSLGSESGDQRLANFPVSISHLELKTVGNESKLDIGLAVSFMGNKDKGFGATTALSLVAGYDDSRDYLSYQFKRAELKEISIDIDQGAYSFYGSLTFFREDPIYGTGMKGVVEAQFQPGIEVNATVLFGGVDGYRYWYADALAQFRSGIMVVPGFGVYGFGGGAYYHMRQGNAEEIGDNTIGRTPSGLAYLPDESVFLGIKASVVVGTHPSPEAFNGEATFEIAFRGNGGIDRISFQGKGYFVTPPVAASKASLQKKAQKLAAASGQSYGDPGEKGQIFADMLVTFDFSNQTLHGNLDVYVNIAGGMVRGRNANNRAGSAVIHFSPDEWYVHIGHPDKRIGLNFAGMFRTGSYMMIGQNIPPMPDPPSNVSNILGKIKSKQSRDLNKLGQGTGFAFGSSMDFSTGNLKFLVFYASFEAGVGFDLMLQNYGPDTRCAGQRGPIGINGWYAQGQAYAYLEGEIGIEVDLEFVKGKYQILDIGAAAILQAKLPNPTWLEGRVGGRYRILGGLVSGTCNFKVTVGQECKLKEGEQSILSDIEIIADMTPSDGEGELSVFTAPQLVLNMPVNEVFELVDDNKRVKAFRVKLEKFEVQGGAGNPGGRIEWNPENDVAAFISNDILPSNKELKAVAEIVFEERKGGSWKPVTFKGKIVREKREVSFTTGDAPSEIPLTNVAYAYPMPAQYNVYKDETDKGYIKLKMGMPELFRAEADWRKVIRFRDSNGNSHETDFTYNNGQKLVNFTFPKVLQPNNIYSLELVNIPTKQLDQVDQNVTLASLSDTDTGVNIRYQQAEGSVESLQEQVFFQTHFRTSRFNTFVAKFNALNISSGWSFPIFPGIIQIGSNVSGNEMFDDFEINGSQGTRPLLQITASLNTPWYQNLIKPLVYDGYPVQGITINWRNAGPLGIPPAKAVFVAQLEADKRLTETEIFNGSTEAFNTAGSFNYELPYIMYQDFLNLKQKAAIAVRNNKDPWIINILNTQYPSIIPGDYNVTIDYTLPGTGEVSSSVNFNIKNL